MGLGLSAARGALWTILSSLGGRVVGLVCTIIITRYLDKAEYGAVMVAISLVLTADEFSRLGLLQYVVAKPDAGRRMAFHASFFHLLFGLLALAAVALFREPLGQYFARRSGELADLAAGAAPAAMNAYILGTCLSSLCDRIAVVPERLLARDMRFGTIALARGSTETLYALVAVLLAWLGLGGFAIIWGNVAQWSAFLVVLAAAAGLREWLWPCRLTWAETRPLFAFGLPLSVGAAAHFASRQWDKLLLARIFGTEMVGRYNLAYSLADIPATHVGEHIGDVLLPSFARMDAATREDALRRGTALLALIITPMAVGLMAVADTAVAVFFDPRWASMAPMLAVLAALSIFRPVGWTIGSYLQARDKPSWVMVLSLAKVLALLGCIAGLSRFGELWACAAVGIAFGLHALASIAAVRRLDGVPFFALLGGLVGPLCASVPLVGAVYGARYLLGLVGLQRTLLALVVEIGAGVLAFAPAAFVCAPHASRNLVGLFRKIVLGRREAEPNAPQGDGPDADRSAKEP
jgi:PST family polysaccharide transporter